MPGRNRRTWVEVSRSALASNFGQYKRFFGDLAQIAPVIKANAYGHSMAQTAKTFRKSQIWGFCVAYDTEALELIEQGITARILVLSAWQPANLTALIRHGVHLVAPDRTALRQIESAARRIRIRARVHLKIDTGTSRIGTRPELLAPFRASASGSPWMTVEGIFSHYADSEAASLVEARKQRRAFIDALDGMRVPFIHMSCSAASLRLPLPPTNLVRLGIGLYGLWPSDATRTNAPRRFTLTPALSWKTRLFQVKRIPAGATVGYGRTYTSRRGTTIGIVPIGYADGYDRRASNVSAVDVAGRECPVIGRVSMNLTVIDLGTSSRARPGDPVTLIGGRITADRLAREWHTINYEVVSRIDRAIPRILVS